MNELPTGSQAMILGYTRHDGFTERLRELGLIAGTTFRLLRRAPLGGPVELQYGHTRVVLRPDELTHLQIDPL
jgi:ferrous iron transport protein A